MRNIFDQYEQPENRLTHALVSSLAQDQRLLRRFVRRMVGQTLVPPFDVYEQSLPGEPLDLSEDEAEARGLPDACIVDRAGLALLIESKIGARLTADQLRRHRRTAERRGLRVCRLLAITTTRGTSEQFAGVSTRTWSEIYEWLNSQAAESDWARNCARYFEVAEAQLARSDYPFEGSLTVFTGIHFGVKEPYQYAEAKRVLDLLRQELLRRPRLARELSIDPKSQGRPAVTGTKEKVVWDYIALRQARDAAVHTKYPHLTLSLQFDRLKAYVTVPNGVSAAYRARLFKIERPEFFERVHKVTMQLDRAVRGTGGQPDIVVVQRRYRTQRSVPIIDARIQFDPRTAFAEFGRDKPAIKRQPEWLDAVFGVMNSRHSNLQFQIGAEFEYELCPVLKTRKILDVIERVWLACAPIVTAD